MHELKFRFPDEIFGLQFILLFIKKDFKHR